MLMWERNIKLVASALDPTRDWTHNLSMGPDWESSLPSIGVQDQVPTIGATQLEPQDLLFMPSSIFVYVYAHITLV